MTLGILTLTPVIAQHYDNEHNKMQHNNTQHNETQHEIKIAKFCRTYAQCS